MNQLSGQVNQLVSDTGKEANKKGKEAAGAAKQGSGQVQKVIEQAVDKGADALKKAGVGAVNSMGSSIPGIGK